MISRSWQMRRVMAKLLLLVERSCSIPPLLIVPKSATGRPLQRRPRGRLVQDVWYRMSRTGRPTGLYTCPVSVSRPLLVTSTQYRDWHIGPRSYRAYIYSLQNLYGVIMRWWASTLCENSGLRPLPHIGPTGVHLNSKTHNK